MAELFDQRTIIPTTLVGDGRGPNVVYTTEDVHYMERYAYVDPMMNYNKAFSMFKHVPINKKGKFYVTDISGDSLIVRSHKNCKTTPTGGFDTRTRNYGSGCPVYIKLQQCYDAWMMDECYRHMISYGGQGVGDGDVDYTPEGNQVLDLHQKEALVQSLRALKSVLFNGGRYDFDKIEKDNMWAEGVTEEKKKRFRDTSTACEGQFAMSKRMAEEFPNMHDSNFIDCDKIDWAKGEYDGDLGDWLRCWVHEKENPRLGYAFDSGIDIGTGGTGTVVGRFSYPLYRLFQSAERQEKQSLATNGRCWTYETVNGIPNVLMYEKRIPIIPHHYACEWDQYLNFETLHAEIDISNNWHFGTSFRNAPDDPEMVTNNGDQIALMFQKQMDLDSDYYGKWTWLMFSMLFVGIARPEMTLAGWKTIPKINYAK